MNNTILTKCLKELGEQTPRLDYVRGMLETLIEMQPKTPGVFVPPTATTSTPISSLPKDEGEILDAIARAKLDEVRRLSNNQ